MELSPKNYDFAGWATRSNRLCSDGRTILPDAFKDQDGAIVPLIWNHKHDDPFAVLGKALLHSVNGDMYAYCAFNDTESGDTARELVQHGDVCSLSICANQLRQNADRGVMHGIIREVSLVVAGANPEARIETVRLAHSSDGNEYEDEIHVYTEEGITLFHSDEFVEDKEDETENKDNVDEKILSHSNEEENKEKKKENSEKTVKEVLEELTDEQKDAVSYVIGTLIKDIEEEKKEKLDHSEGGNEDMKVNVFDRDDTQKESVLTHADQQNIIAMAKGSNVGSFRAALNSYIEENDTLKHAFVNSNSEDAIDTLFPDYKDVRPGAPELVERDQNWVSVVMKKISKSPISRIRTRQADVRGADLRANGYKTKGDEKKIAGDIVLMSRTTDPQTVYRKDELHRDDIIDITDFSVAEYLYGIMRKNLEEEIALAALIGDGREAGDPDKIHESHIRSIWNDNELYTIHTDVDIAKAKTELQGTDTSAHFGDNYIYAEAIITAALYSRERYKGTGTPDLYCTPHLVNVMLLARDLNGRRIYDSKADLAAALNVGSIYTVEQFEGRIRDAGGGKKKKLLGLFVNLNDYQFGCTKGGEITRFNQFDIDFNKEKYLIETRLSGALTRIYSAIALEEPVTEAAAG